MVRRRRRAGPTADEAPLEDQGVIDDTGSLVKLSGDQAASGFAQGIGAVVVVYAVARVLRGLAGFLRGGSSR